MKPPRIAPCLSAASYPSSVSSPDSMKSGGMYALFQRWLDRERPPARIRAEVAADLLGFQADDMAVLARHGIIMPLGNPSPNAVKYYATIEVAALSEDRGRLDKATELIYERNRQKAALQEVEEN